MSADSLDETLEAHRRAVLGDRYEVPQEKTYEDHVRDALEAERAARREASRKPPQPTMAEFAAAERAKRLPTIHKRDQLVARTRETIEKNGLDGYGSQRRRG
jgi:hypothetical protein